MEFNGVAMLVNHEKHSCSLKPVRVEYTNTISQLKALYKLLDCDTVEVVHFHINNRDYVVYLDEEGKNKTPWVPTGVLRYKDGEIVDILAGSYLVVRLDEEEDFQELTEEEIENISKYMRREFFAAAKAVQEIKR